MGETIFNNTAALLKRILPWLLVVTLPLTLVLPHIESSFFGTDFLFPYNTVGDFYPTSTLWSDDYLGGRNISAGMYISTILSTFTYKLAGAHYAPHLYIYITLALYLGVLYLLARRIRQEINTCNQNSFSDSLIIVFAFVSPMLLGYFANFFSIGLILSMVPAGASLLFLVSYIFKKRISNLLLASLFSALISHAPSCFFFFGFVCIILFALHRFKALIIYIGLFLGLSMIWLTPLAFSLLAPGGASLSADTSYISHIFTWYSNATNILLSAIFSVYPNNKLFNIIPIGTYVALFCVSYAVIFMYVYRKPLAHKKTDANTLLLTLLLVCMLGFAFSFGGKYATGTIFTYLWTHVSALHFFKSFTQILNVTFLFFIALLAGTLTCLSRTQRIIAFISLSVCCVVILTYLPSLNAHLFHGTIPQNYYEAKAILDNDSELSRILSLPEIPYIYYKWNGDWDQYVIEQRWFTKSVVYFSIIAPTTSKTIYPRNTDYSDLFIQNNFRYLLIHKDYAKDKFKTGKFSFDYSKVDVVLSNEYFDVYRLKDTYFTPRIYAEVPSRVTQALPTRYQVYIPELFNTTYFTMLEGYDNGWKIVPAKIEGDCSHQNGTPNTFAMLSRTPFADQTHQITQGYANGWSVDPGILQSRYSSEYYKKNVNGSIGVCLTVYYQPQAYFNIGAMGTFGVLLLTLLNVIMLRLKERYA